MLSAGYSAAVGVLQCIPFYAAPHLFAFLQSVSLSAYNYEYLSGYRLRSALTVVQWPRETFPDFTTSDRRALRLSTALAGILAGILAGVE